MEKQPAPEEIAYQATIEPVSEDQMWWRERYAGYPTICMTLRSIYNITEDPEIKLKCRLAMAMAKAMNDKLQWYKTRDENARPIDSNPST